VDAKGEEPPGKGNEKSYDAIQVGIFWGDCLLDVQQWAPLKNLFASSDPAQATRVDVLLLSDSDAVGRIPLVRVRRGQVSIVVPPNVQGQVWSPSGSSTIASLIEGGEAQPFVKIPGAHEVPFPKGAQARLVTSNSRAESGDHVVLLRRTTTHLRTRRPWRTWFSRTGALPYVLLSLFTHGGVLAAASSLTPPAWLTDDDGPTRDELYTIYSYVLAAQEREEARFAASGQTPPKREASQWKPVTPSGDWSSWYAPRWQLFPDGGWLYAQDDDPLVQRYIGVWEPTAIAPGFYVLPDAHLERFQNYHAGNAPIDYFPGPERMDRFADGVGTGPYWGQRASVRLSVSGNAALWTRNVILHRAYKSLGRVRLCYDQGLRKNSNLQGTIRLGVMIDERGVVSTIRNNRSDLPDLDVVRCVMLSVRIQPFPESLRIHRELAFELTLTPGGR